jgi:hypothetical protein
VKVDIDFEIASGEYKGTLVTGQVGEAIGRAVGRLGIHTDSRHAAIVQAIDSITFRCYRHSDKVGYDVDALITVKLRSSPGRSSRRYRFVTCTAAYRLGEGAPTEDFGEDILDAVAGVLMVSRPERMK